MTSPEEVAASDVLFISLDSCRYDTFRASYRRGMVPHLASLGPLHKAMAPSYFTYGSHAAFWMGFTPGVVGSSTPLLNPKVLKLFRLKYGERPSLQADDAPGFALDGANVIDARLQELQPEQPCVAFPCEPFGGPSCSALESRRRQRACLAWVDQQLAPLLQRFRTGMVLVCADHGDCWGENGLWAHGFSHPAILTVPLILRVRGEPVHA